jgi:hypothetical protein
MRTRIQAGGVTASPRLIVVAPELTAASKRPTCLPTIW